MRFHMNKLDMFRNSPILAIKKMHTEKKAVRKTLVAADISISVKLGGKRVRQ